MKEKSASSTKCPQILYALRLQFDAFWALNMGCFKGPQKGSGFFITHQIHHGMGNTVFFWLASEAPVSCFCWTAFLSRSSSREVRISWYQLFSVIYFSRGTLSQKSWCLQTFYNCFLLSLASRNPPPMPKGASSTYHRTA